jgi:LPS sulfotransferase NodH
MLGFMGTLPSIPMGKADEAWRAWFEANGIEPLTIAYEALDADAPAPR